MYTEIHTPKNIFPLNIFLVEYLLMFNIQTSQNIYVFQYTIDNKMMCMQTAHSTPQRAAVR